MADRPGTGSPGMLAVDAAGIPKVLPISRALWLKLDSQGRVPRGFKLGRRRLWDIDELKRWIAAGAPSAERWARMREEKP